MKTRYNGLKWALILVSVIGLWACRSGGPVTQLSGEVTGQEKVLVLPFQNMAWLHGANVNVTSPLTGKVFMTGPASDDANRLLTDLLIDALRQQTDFQILPSRDASALMERLKSSGVQQRRPLDVLVQAGRLMKTELVVQGYLYRFEDRVGKDYSAESPASVAFEVHLINSDAQKLVWSGYFDQTQQALTDDLRYIGTFFRRGGRWVTAEDMTRTAMVDMFKEFQQP
jgi:hypothetical protein